MDAQQTHRRHCRVEEILGKVQTLVVLVAIAMGKRLNRLTCLTAPTEPVYASLTIRTPNTLSMTPEYPLLSLRQLSAYIAKSYGPIFS